jgi:hypothetical protein
VFARVAVIVQGHNTTVTGSPTMSTRGRTPSPHLSRDADVDMDSNTEKPDARVVLVTNLTRNVVEAHLQTIFGFYGQIVKVDFPVYGKCKFADIVLYLCCTELICPPRQLVKTRERHRLNSWSLCLRRKQLRIWMEGSWMELW